MIMEELAQKYLVNHNKSLTKIELPSIKRFLPNKNNGNQKEEEEEKEKYLNNIRTALERERVDRRSQRSKGVWLNEEQLVKITKLVGSIITHLGFQNKSGKFLYPEEALYMLEMNKLELSNNDISLSIQEAYELLLNPQNYSLRKYLVYKKLVVQGYRLLKILKTSKEEEPPLKKIKCDNLQESSCSSSTLTNNSVIKTNLEKIFKKLLKTAPKEIENGSSSRPPDYYVFLPNSNINKKPDFNLYVVDDLDDIVFDDRPNILALCSGNNFIGFYRCNHVNIPSLEI